MATTLNHDAHSARRIRLSDRDRDSLATRARHAAEAAEADDRPAARADLKWAAELAIAARDRQLLAVLRRGMERPDGTTWPPIFPASTLDERWMPGDYQVPSFDVVSPADAGHLMADVDLDAGRIDLFAETDPSDPHQSFGSASLTTRRVHGQLAVLHQAQHGKLGVAADVSAIGRVLEVGTSATPLGQIYHLNVNLIVSRFVGGPGGTGLFASQLQPLSSGSVLAATAISGEGGLKALYGSQTLNMNVSPGDTLFIQVIADLSVTSWGQLVAANFSPIGWLATESGGIVVEDIVITSP